MIRVALPGTDDRDHRFLAETGCALSGAAVEPRAGRDKTASSIDISTARKYTTGFWALAAPGTGLNNRLARRFPFIAGIACGWRSGYTPASAPMHVRTRCHDTATMVVYEHAMQSGPGAGGIP